MNSKRFYCLVELLKHFYKCGAVNVIEESRGMFLASELSNCKAKVLNGYFLQTLLAVKMKGILTVFKITLGIDFKFAWHYHMFLLPK